jgi:arylsulfatase A-like enzyme
MESHLLRSGVASLVTLLVIVAGLVAGVARAADPARPPNIVFILTDDQGWADLETPMDPAAPEGACDYFHTPNLDRLAREGMRFASGYAPAPLCTPTRRSIQFGMTPARQRGTEFVSDTFMPAGHLSIPQALRRANPAYRCAHFGKWGEHMSGPATPPPNYDPNMAANPTALGYDESDGLTGNLTGTQYFKGLYGAEKAKLDTVLSPDPDPKRTFSVTRRAVGFMERCAADKEPFYLQVSYYAIHEALQALPATIEKYRDRGPPPRPGMAGIAPMLEDLDTGVGEVLDAIDRLGLADNTYVFFSSDNGGSPIKPATARKDPADRNHPLKGAKQQLFEGGIRVPFLVRGPGVPAGAVCREPVAQYDLLPTFYDLAGGREPMPEEIDGGSLRPLLGNPASGAVQRPLPGLVFHRPLLKSQPHSAFRAGDFKLVVTWSGPGQIGRRELFNLADDLGERNDLAASMPEKAAELETVLVGYLASVNAETAAAPPKRSARPNVVIIYADDLGYGDVQCSNPDRGRIPTPHIDRLAAQGMRFTDGHSSSGVCSPSRYTLLTGRYHWRTKLQSGIVDVFGEPLIAPGRMTIATLAKNAGYRTACIGKWHLGWDWPIPPDKRPLFDVGKTSPEATDAHRSAWQEVFSQPVGGGPTAHGFDEFFGVDIPNWPPFCFIENDRPVGVPTEFLPARLLENNQASIGGPALEDWKLEPTLPALGDRATRFIAEQARAKRPFLLYLPLTTPHTPLAVNEPWKGKSGLNAYADLVMETDALVGRILKALRDGGVANDTLVVFTSDNGCAPYIGMADLEKMGHFPSGPLRGAKADAWEGGHRVPFIVRWPGTVKPGSVCRQLVQQSDLMATFAEVLGTKLPDDAGEDSVSLVPLFEGADRPVRGDGVSTSIGGTPAVRSGGWKYIPAPGSGGWGTGGDQSQPVQLYNLDDDLGETKNLAAAMPEKVAAMQALLEKLITEGRSTPGARQQNDVEVKRYPAKPAGEILDSNLRLVNPDRSARQGSDKKGNVEGP